MPQVSQVRNFNHSTMKKVIISVIILIVLALLAVLGIRLVNEGSPRSHETTREGTEIISEALSWYRGGEKISGKIFKPCDENGVFDTSFGARPLVVFFHDPMKTVSAGKLIARLVPMGVIGYSVDCPAKAEDMSFLISKMGKQEYVDKDRIFIIADSSSSDKAVNALLKVGRKTAGAILLEPRLQGKAAVTVDRHGAELLVVTEEQSADAFGLIRDYMEERGAFK